MSCHHMPQRSNACLPQAFHSITRPNDQSSSPIQTIMDHRHQQTHLHPAFIETIPLKWQEEPAGPSAACTQQLSAPSGAGGSPAGEAAAGAREPPLPALAGRPRPRRPAGAGRARSLPPRAPLVSMQQRKAGRAARSRGAAPGTAPCSAGGPWPLQHLDGEKQGIGRYREVGASVAYNTAG